MQACRLPNPGITHAGCCRHTDFVTALDFHPNDDKHFLSGSIDGKVGMQAQMKLHAFAQLLSSLQQPSIT